MSSLAPHNPEEHTIFQSCLLLERAAHKLDQQNPSLNQKETKNLTKSPTKTEEPNGKMKQPPSPWNIGSTDTLPDAANIFPLERTRVTLEEEDYVSPNEVGQRIITSLQKLSITIISTKRNKLLAESIDRDVRFYVRLYKQKAASSGVFHVMVELQKRRGCSLSFGHVAQIILQSTKNNTYSNYEEQRDEEEQENDREVLPQHQYNQQPVEETNDFHPSQSMDDDDTTDSSFCSDIKHIVALINDDHVDISLLGMQDLAILTNAEITNRTTALSVAKLVLGSENDSDGLGLSDLVQNFVVRGSQPYTNNNNRWEDDTEQWYFERMHYYALTILANSLQVVWSDCFHNETKVHLQTNIDSERWLDEQNGILFRLIHELANVNKYLHHEYQAKRCINIIFQVLPTEVSKRAIELGASRSIHTAKSTGNSCRSLLTHELEIATVASNRSTFKAGFGPVECI